MISQPIDSLPANSFFTSIAALDSDNEVWYCKLFLLIKKIEKIDKRCRVHILDLTYNLKVIFYIGI